MLNHLLLKFIYGSMWVGIYYIIYKIIVSFSIVPTYCQPRVMKTKTGMVDVI